MLSEAKHFYLNTNLVTRIALRGRDASASLSMTLYIEQNDCKAALPRPQAHPEIVLRA
ncbi:hypothetical protein GCM10022409_45970 [Hymenobacter glaciei]|uniref:Uncharacterized protein n=1 Tax=Hymenobacter glaciei TaxID=877209 RepID=A0ABP7UVQ4_9BACT